MKFNELKTTKAKQANRVGRGIAAGQGKTAGRGTKGQNSRAGSGRKPGFEGGQNPLYKRIPKRGFTNIFATNYSVVNLDRIVGLGLTEVNPEILIEKRVLKNNYGLLKILGQGELTTAINVKAHKFSATAKKAIEAAGGKAELI